ncbi:MAG: hypothetical protein Q8R55_04570 [Candidatus Taylorbacteria bacterium]|nr:hypothetical protein [Candidatus Taylorbacteria bacterium]
MWNLWWASEKYGVDNILVVHVRGLNRNNGPSEVKHVLNQQKKLGFKHLEVIELHNGSLNTGYQVMRSRDMFLSGIITPIAMKFGASQIITEGFQDTEPTEPFSGQESNMVYFNEILRKLDIPVQVNWHNRDEMLTVKDLFENKPAWMPYVCNCFTIACYQSSHRSTFQKVMPTFPLYGSQCGVCVKCRIINVARILYDPSTRKVRPQDIRTFLENNDSYVFERIRKNKVKGINPKNDNLKDMIRGPFMREFAIACKEYGVKAHSLSEVANV